MNKDDIDGREERRERRGEGRGRPGGVPRGCARPRRCDKISDAGVQQPSTLPGGRREREGDPLRQARARAVRSRRGQARGGGEARRGGGRTRASRGGDDRAMERGGSAQGGSRQGESRRRGHRRRRGRRRGGRRRRHEHRPERRPRGRLRALHVHARGQVQARRIRDRRRPTTDGPTRDPAAAAAPRTDAALHPAAHPHRRLLRRTVGAVLVAGVWMRRVRLQPTRVLRVPHGPAGEERVQAGRRASLRRPVRPGVPPDRGGVGERPSGVHQQDQAGG